MRFRLRYQATDIEISPGEFVVGRSSACSLALDDGLVSRRHAVFRVSDREVKVEDLGSRNGIAVNGTAVVGSQVLAHMDRVTVGSQELVLLVGSQKAHSETLQFETCFRCKALVPEGRRKCTECGAIVGTGGAPTLAGASATLRDMPAFGDVDEPTHVGSAFRLLAGIADKALALGRFDEAERVLGPSLENLDRDTASGRNVASQTIEDGVEFAIRLAEGPRAQEWIAWLFRVHASAAVWMTLARIERMHELVRSARYSDPRPLRAYLDALRSSGELRPAERFLVKQLEGLERVIRA